MDIDEDEDLVSFSKSVGRAAKPSATESYPTEQVQNQKTIAAARGNATQPDPLPSKKRKADCDGGSLLDCQLEDISDDKRRMEWLYQAIERSGDKHDYRNDPEFQDEGALFEVWEEARANQPAKYDPPRPRAQGFQIHSGLTKVLELQKSSRSSASKLVRTDQTTIGLDSTPVNTPNTGKSGYSAPIKLSQTDKTTIGLDSTHVNIPDRREHGYLHPTTLTGTNRSTTTLGSARLSPPHAEATHHHTLNTATTPHHPPPHVTGSATNALKASIANRTTTLQKRLIIPRAWIEAICREDAAKAHTLATGAPSHGNPAHPSSATNRSPRNNPQLPPAADIEMSEQGDDELEAPQQLEKRARLALELR
ncbi:hypothetical protein FRC06_009100 [Ceratobasidium sp. 370]|nr:hypothetical protein FRC06_009100 [Ceratobasidium sp. 370]